MMQSIARRKRKGDNKQPCFTPVLTSKLSVSLPSCMTALHVVIRVPDDVDELLRYSIVCH
jgi:hypothetical protein